MKQTWSDFLKKLDFSPFPLTQCFGKNIFYKWKKEKKKTNPRYMSTPISQY